eukprot:CAMPEP_0117421152 /NCGR_PEP_ID=MMETSP0758-20121206/2319_1 /TAXON_ID=63605 /ORGANISM="Percolomonas cosmopolitus, Strain AE-1 (ATCC 50343)" /LENGTH=379 /DNA_ID=CAMNT_0005203141 /DNA_START=15 /DNA_END=1151 /DNA_ORIENTATION=+
MTKNSVYIWGLIPDGVEKVRKIKQWEPLKIKQKNVEGNPIKIRAGAHWYAFLTDKGNVYTWGEGKGYRTGNGSIVETGVPQKIKFPNSALIEDICIGHWHGLALSTTGQLFGWGKLFDAKEPIPLTIPCKVKKMACGLQTAAILSDVNELYVLGSNEMMQLGLPSPVKVKSWKKVNVSNKLIAHVAFGAKFAFAITLSGEVFGWGKNDGGELGRLHKGQCVLPRQIYVNMEDPAVSVSCSVGERYCHASISTLSGKCYTIGSGYKHKLGHGDSESITSPRVIDFFVKQNLQVLRPINGGIHSSCLCSDGALYTFGCGSDGRLGHKEGSNYVYLYKETEPRAIESLGKCVMDADFSYYAGCAITSKNYRPPPLHRSSSSQ